MRKQYIDFVPTKSNKPADEAGALVRPGRRVGAGVLMPSGGQRKVRSAHSNVTGQVVNTGGAKIVENGRTPMAQEVVLARPGKSRAKTSTKSPKKSLMNVLRTRKTSSGNTVKSRSRAASVGARLGSVGSRGGMVSSQITPYGKKTSAHVASQKQPLGTSRRSERGVQVDTRVPVKSNKAMYSGTSRGSRGGVQMEMHTATSDLKVSSDSKTPVLGVIEETNVRFVRTDVPKRPLGEASHFVERKTGVSAVKAKKVGIGGVTKGRMSATGSVGTQSAVGDRGTRMHSNAAVGAARTKPVNDAVRMRAATGVRMTASSDANQNRMTIAKKERVSTYQMPKSPFINQGKVQKRPLSSKNVYPRKTPVSRKEPSGPVTIISESEKSSRVGLIVTIVLTIVLGAAAGTIAFLLLPK